MKKHILAGLMMTLLVAQASGQISFGLKAGLNFDVFKFENAKSQINLDNASGWHAGALLLVKVPVIGIAVQPELLYMVSKANIDSEDNKIHYFEVPVNLQWGLDLPLIRPFIQGGPYFGYALQAEGAKLKDNIEKFDWGIALGAGIDVWKLQLSACYSWGLHELSKDVSEFKLKNNRFNLSLGFLF